MPAAGVPTPALIMDPGLPEHREAAAPGADTGPFLSVHRTGRPCTEPRCPTRYGRGAVASVGCVYQQARRREWAGTSRRWAARVSHCRTRGKMLSGLDESRLKLVTALPRTSGCCSSFKS